MAKILFQHSYHHIISLENLLEAWKEFVKGKRLRKDVQEFERNLMTNIISLHHDLVVKTYVHSTYNAFKIADSKPRDIHKASVRDRLLHHALHRKLSAFFARTFISDSYSCQNGKGTHRALERFRTFTNIVSKNNTRVVWVLKCDIRKFFANIDHAILLKILVTYIPDTDIMSLISNIVKSFHSGVACVGLPLGNLTSQLLVNIYMNEFDQFMKHRLKAKYYIRYADDFVVLSHDRSHLDTMLQMMQEFLRDRLKLTMHPDKVFIKTVASGVDFLGWVHFPDHRILRGATRKRMLRNIAAKREMIGVTEKEKLDAVIQSYLGLLSHGNTYGLQKEIK